MIATLVHRGPDGEGIFIESNVGLAHKRLSIQDLSEAGHQPMTSACGRFVISYNGEIYNCPELRTSLPGVAFRGHSDTEVILELFAKEGVASLPRLNGMFALAIFDRSKRTVYMARDRFGIKPLYYSVDSSALLFGSEPKAITANGDRGTKLNVAKLPEYLMYGTTLGENLLNESMQRLLPGHLLKCDVASGTVDVSPYFSIGDYSRVLQNQSIVIEDIQRLLRESVSRHLVSDVPVGVFLSGGIDSSAITAFAAEELGSSLKTYSVEFDVEGEVSELASARMVADRFGTDHHEFRVTVKDVRSTLESLHEAHDLPFSDAANIPLFLLCEQLTDGIKVILQGDGGDEVFGGYSRYRWLRRAALIKAVSNIAKFSGAGRLLASRFPAYDRVLRAFREGSAKRMALLLTEETMSSDSTRALSPELCSQAQSSDPFERYREVSEGLNGTDHAQNMLLTDCQIILPDIFLEKVDRSTMAHSIEVRVPFLDTELTDQVFRLPSSAKIRAGETKYLLKKALRGVLPNEILDRPKTGFSVPYKTWMRGDLGDWLLELLNDKWVRNSGILDARYISSILEKHRRGEGRYGFLLYKLMILALWVQRSKVTL
jgi:asparagine synthase (glutamine-hydrolysing)